MCATLANFTWLRETLAQFLNPERKVFFIHWAIHSSSVNSEKMYYIHLYVVHMCTSACAFLHTCATYMCQAGWQVYLPTKPSPYLPPTNKILKTKFPVFFLQIKTRLLELWFLQTEFQVADCRLPSRYESCPARHSSILFSICLKPLESLRGARLLCSASNNTDLGLQFAVAQWMLLSSLETILWCRVNKGERGELSLEV